MVNKRIGLGILVMVMVLVFGMTIVGCDNGSTSGGAAAALNGTWVYDNDEGRLQEIKLNNGNYEAFTDGILQIKGTYTTDNDIITTTPTATRAWGLELEQLGLEDKLYTKAEMTTALTNSGFSYVAMENLEEWIQQEYFSPVISRFSVNGNKLTIKSLDDDHGDNYESTYTRK